MKRIQQTVRRSFRDRGWIVVLMLGAVMVWGALRPDPNAQAQGQEYPQTPPLQAFKSGSERSEAVLKEILTVLQRMDARLEKIEAAAANVTANQGIR
jgi:hypothetical protein